MRQRKVRKTKHVDQIELNGRWHDLLLVRNVVDEFTYSNLSGDTFESMEEVSCKDVVADLISIGVLRSEGGERFTSVGFANFRQELEKLSRITNLHLPTICACGDNAEHIEGEEPNLTFRCNQCFLINSIQCAINMFEECGASQDPIKAFLQKTLEKM